ncbi:unnamed protein product [Clonostachys byssicola]|uniref:F-box domain-containing protein n=1 Tax=Clonostachys byssicola TaxID=160290 RepID=A0A9N9XZB1_9HYPO|nr:unnamed protein product [Clonostachys byssicola]
MEPFMCTLCGVAVSSSFGEAWLKEFRVIYAQPPSWDDVRLSGVCSAGETDEYDPRDVGVFIARCPRDASKRYDDQDLDPGSKVMVKLGPAAPKPFSHMTPSVSRCGFAFHAACWDLLAKIGHIDISVLFGVCFSMPIVDAGIIQWGHDYGGAARSQHYSTQSQPYGSRWAGFMPEELFSHIKSSLFRSDPMNIPDLYYLTQCAVRFEPPTYPWHSRPVTSDLFYRLPVEILQAILPTLSSPDVASLRSASRVVACIDLPESFWASRFQDGYEYAHIFETSLQRPRSWKALYMFTRILERQSHALQNRARVWKLGLKLKKLHDQVEGVSCQGLPLASKFEPDCIGDDREWFMASDGLLENTSDDWYNLREGCRGLRIREIQLPTSLKFSHLAVSFNVVDNRKFVSGLQFMTRGGEYESLGYITLFQQTITLPTTASMSALHLALSKSGIKAIAVELDDRTLSPWAGEPGACPQWRLSTPAGASVKAEFDNATTPNTNLKEAMRLLSLGLDEKAELPGKDRCFWKSDVPAPGILCDLSYDESSFRGPEAFRPPLLEKALFQPATLVGVTAYLFDLNAVAGIEFKHADSTHDSLLGQRMPFGRRPYWPNLYPPHGEDHASSVSVDGPGGERITEIRIEENMDGPLEMETLKLKHFGLLSMDVEADEGASSVRPLPVRPSGQN